MATQTIPTSSIISNTQSRDAATQAAFERLNASLVAGLPTDGLLFVNVDGMRDPGPDFTPRAWGWLS